jgi:PAS domain S-box-containing protein
LRLYKRLSYQNKLLIFMMAMVIFVGGTMGLLIRFIILPHLALEMENRGEAVVRRLVESTRTFILSREIDSLTVSLFDEKRLEQSIAYILVGDHEDRLLAHTFVGLVPDIDPQVFQVADGQMKHGLAAVAHGSPGEISDIVAPVYEGLYQIGTIRVGIDKRHIHAVIRRVNLYHLGFMAFTVLVSLVFAMYLSRVVTRPIRLLTKAAGEISLGNLDTRILLGDRHPCWDVRQCDKTQCPAYGKELMRCWFVDDTSSVTGQALQFPEKLNECRSCAVYRNQVGDEIVQLADAFNHMSQRLKGSEQELRHSEERYRLLFNLDPNPVFVVALDSSAILDVNDRAAENYGYPRDTLLGMRFAELGLPQDSQRVMAAFEGLRRNPAPYALIPRVCHRRRDGELFWVNIYFCNWDYLGTAGVIVSTTDISDIVETETKLIQAGKMATLGEMSTGVAHELNQPLNAIKLGSEFLLTMREQGRTVPETQFQEVAAEISKAVDRAAAIIDHLREFGRRSLVSKQKIDVNRAVRGVFTILGQQLKVHGIEVTIDLDEMLPPIMADENRIEQVLVNLVNNARDAMEARAGGEMETGPAVLTVRSFLESDRVVVTVADTGTGIPPRVRDRVFEPFFTTKEVGKGTGLGLSISYGIVRDYDGTIDFETAEGVGTTFKLSFPMAPREDGHG